jgi:hypothetical protein
VQKTRVALLSVLLGVAPALGVVFATPGQAQTSSGGTTSSNGEPHNPVTPNVHAATFSQCPAIGADSGCAILLVINPDGTVSVQTDASQGPFDGNEDTLVGVQNNSSFVVTSLNLTSNNAAFDFDTDGLCTFTFTGSGGCPFGKTGYEGPNTSFSNISADFNDGTVNFTGGLGPGASAFFSLENVVTASGLTVAPLTPPTTPTTTPPPIIVRAAFTG